MSWTVHAAGIAGLIGVVIVGTLRPINLGVLAFVATFLIGLLAGQRLRRGFSGSTPVHRLWPHSQRGADEFGGDALPLSRAQSARAPVPMAEAVRTCAAYARVVHHAAGAGQ
jgi:hypothetical protein